MKMAYYNLFLLGFEYKILNIIEYRYMGHVNQYIILTLHEFTFGLDRTAYPIGKFFTDQ